MTVIGAGSYSIKSVNYNNDITVIKDNQDTDTNVSSSGINSKLDNAEAASDKSVDDVYADDEQVKEADKTPRHSDPKNFTFDFKKGNEFNLEGATRDYEDIGGNSLQAVRLTNLISEKFDLEVGIGELFENSTVRRMSELIGEKGIK